MYNPRHPHPQFHPHPTQISVTLFRKFPSENPSMCLSIVSMRIEATQDHLLFVTNAMCHPDAKVSIVSLCHVKNLC
jgi:hypothetical protein